MLRRLRAGAIGAAATYAGAVAGYALVRPLIRHREGWLELADDLEPWAYVPAPAIWLGGALLGSASLSTAGAGLAAIFGLRWGHRFFRRPTPRPEARAATDLVVMTYNTLAWQREGHDLAASIVKANPDLVGLQELGTNGAEYLAQTLADRYPYHFITNASSSSGAAVLSRYPLRDPVAFRASPAGHWWQRMTVESPAGPIAYVNLHTRIPYVRKSHRKLGGLAAPLEYRSDRRRGEVEKLIEMVRQIEGPAIVTGDFNMTEHCQDHRALSAVLRDAYREVGAGFGHTFPRVGMMPRLFPVPWPVLRLDYVWHSDHFIASWAARGDAGKSDHHPIVAGLRWSEPVRQVVGPRVPLAASAV
ncbi:MAG: endonuclease/exonuclease/phosphatase family protein [Chloroflexota bacterium]